MESHSESSLVSELAGLLKDTPIPKELEVTILPCENDEDVNTSSFMKEGVHLGIHAPNVPKLARAFRKIYYSLRNVAFDSIDSKNDSMDNLMDCISCLLLLCPDHATAWADRRRCLLKRVSALEKKSVTACMLIFWIAELGYITMLFTQHSKAPNAWGHRRWVCRQMLALFSLENRNGALREDWHPSESIIQWATLEIAVCSVIAETYPKNYYAWTHRIFVIRTLANIMSTSMCTKNDDNGRENIKAVLETEASLTEPWLCRHVSDHSAAHYGGEALALWLQVGGGSNVTRKWKMAIVQGKLQESRRLIMKFPSHEVIWTWRRICSKFCFVTFTKEEALSFLQEEISFASSIFDEASSNDAKEIEMQRHFSMAYIVWILKYARECDFDLISLMDDINVIKGRVRQMEMPKSVIQVLMKLG